MRGILAIICELGGFFPALWPLLAEVRRDRILSNGFVEGEFDWM